MYSAGFYDADIDLAEEKIGDKSCKIQDCKKEKIEKIIHNINLIRKEERK